MSHERLSHLDCDELDDMLRRLARLEAKVAAESGRNHDPQPWAVEPSYLDGLADALAIMQGREPSRPDPVAR